MFQYSADDSIEYGRHIYHRVVKFEVKNAIAYALRAGWPEHLLVHVAMGWLRECNLAWYGAE